MIRAIIFDCFGVLATDVWLAFCESLLPGSDITQASALNKAYDRGIISYTDFVQGVTELVGQAPPDLEHITLGDIAKNEPLLQLIGQLKAEYKIGLLSNVSSDWIQKEFLTAKEQELFDAVVLSYEVGMIKPDPRIYELICTRLGVDPSEAVMVDDRQAYAEGAQQIGMKCIVYEDLRSFTRQLNQLLDSNYEPFFGVAQGLDLQ